MHELTSVFRPEKTITILHPEIRILKSSEYKSDKNLVILVNKLQTEPVKWNMLTESYINRNKFRTSDKELPGIFFELHADRIVKELAANNKNFVPDPIPEGFSTEHYVFRKNKGLGQTTAHPQDITGTSLTYCEYDNLLVATSENGYKYLIAIEVKSGSLGEAATEEYRNKLFGPLKEYSLATPESGISGLGYILITTNKQKPNHLGKRITGDVEFKEIGVLVSIGESRENFVADALKAGKTLR